MKRLTNILLILAVVLSFALLASCSDDVASSVSYSKSYANVDFRNDSKSLSSSVADLESLGGADALYWTYTATPKKSGAVGTQTEEKAVKADGSSGLGTVMGFEVGEWTFRLFAYKNDTFETVLYESTEVSANLASGQTVAVTFPLKKAQREDQLGTIHIVMDEIRFIMPNGEFDPDEYELGDVTLNGPATYQLTSATGYSMEVKPGTYSLFLDFVHGGYTYLAYLDGINIYSNFETAIKGTVEGRIASAYNVYYHDVDGTFHLTEESGVYTGKDIASLPQKHWYGTANVLPAGGVRDFFTFNGWFSDAEGLNSITEIDSEVNEDYHVYAKWTPITYAIIYDYNAIEDNATDPTLDITGLEGNPASYDYSSPTVTLSNNVTRTGYAFNGWSSGTDTTTSTSMQIPQGCGGDLSFKANWREFKYNIHFDSNLASATDVDAEHLSGEMEDITDIPYSSVIALPPNAFIITSGWKVQQWVREDGTVVSGGLAANVSKLTDVDGATVVLKADWVETGDTIYTVEHYFENLEGSSSDLNNYTRNDSFTNTHNDGVANRVRSAEPDVITTLSEIVGFDYSADLSSATNSGVLSYSNDTVFKLYYSRKVRSLNWDFDGGYPVNEDVFTTAGDYKWDTEILVPTGNQMVKDGYTFDSWDYTGWDEASTPTNMPDTNLTIKAVWVANPYKVRFTTGTGGGGSTLASGSMADEEFTFDEGAKALTANAFTKDGYTFAHWKRTDVTTTTTYTDGQSVANLTTECDHIVVLEAVWTSNTYCLTFSGNRPTTATSSLEGDTANLDCVFDRDVVLPDSGFTLGGYTFKGWTTDSDNEGTLYNTSTNYINFTTASNGVVSLYAKWEANKYTVHYDGNEHGNTAHRSRSSVTNLTADTERIFDQPATKLAQNGFVRTGYTFKGWSTDSNATLNNGATIYTTTNNYDVNFSTGTDVTLYAVWEINTYTVTINVVNKAVSENGVTKTTTSTVFGKVKSSDVEVTSVTKVEYKEVISTTNYSFYVTTTDGVKVVDGVPETSTTDYAYSFDAWYRQDGTATLNGLSVESDVTVTAVFERRENPHITPSIKFPTEVVIDFKSANLELYKNATLGSVSFSMEYGTEFSDLDNDIFGGCTLTGYQIEGLYLDTSCTDLVVAFSGESGFKNHSGIIENGIWVQNGGTITVYAKWTQI